MTLINQNPPPQQQQQEEEEEEQLQPFLELRLRLS